ncbi:MAG TPA: hypothetical protein VGX68_07595 [Thermoanaerobaculia bacterium]|jgi:hypothetical protein|nr:hypothetical protein [Thermoanaerobaculia bacterium]
MGKQSQQKTQAGVLGVLTRLSAALEANSQELSHLEGTRLRFANLVSEALEAAREQAALAAEKQEASQRLTLFLNEGMRLATGLSRLLREFYGVGSEKLTEFGLQPFRGRTRRSKPDEPETPPPPPVVEVEAEKPAADGSEV